MAVELAEKIFETIKSRKVLVIGAGDTAEKICTLLYLAKRPEIIFTNRSIEKARVLASEFNGTVIPF